MCEKYNTKIICKCVLYVNCNLMYNYNIILSILTRFESI